jgi:hypothetical protein
MGIHSGESEIVDVIVMCCQSKCKQCACKQPASVSDRIADCDKEDGLCWRLLGCCANEQTGALGKMENRGSAVVSSTS